MKRFLLLFAVLIGLLYTSSAEARPLGRIAHNVRSRVSARVDNRVAHRAVRRGLAFNRPAVVFRNGVALRRNFNRALLVSDFRHDSFRLFDRRLLLPQVAFLPSFRRTLLVAEDTCPVDPGELPIADDPGVVALRRAVFFASGGY